MPKIDLLPCPFCGGKAETFPLDKYDSYENHERLWYSYCGECFARNGIYNTEGEAAIAWNTRASGWIPCSERMPEKDGDYLCISNNEYKILPYRNGEFYCVCFDSVLRCCNSSVTSWMPLPEAPKEAYNEQNT